MDDPWTLDSRENTSPQLPVGSNLESVCTLCRLSSKTRPWTPGKSMLPGVLFVFLPDPSVPRVVSDSPSPLVPSTREVGGPGPTGSLISCHSFEVFSGTFENPGSVEEALRGDSVVLLCLLGEGGPFHFDSCPVLFRVYAPTSDPSVAAVVVSVAYLVCRHYTTQRLRLCHLRRKFVPAVLQSRLFLPSSRCGVLVPTGRCSQL